METLTLKVIPPREYSKAKLKSALKLLDFNLIEIQQEKEVSEKLAQKIEQARKEYKEGKTIRVNPENIRESIL